MTDDQRVTLIHGDCVVHMRAMEANSVDAIVCDPPYALSFMGKSWDSFDVPGGSYGNQGAGATGRAHSHGLAYNVPTAFQAWCVEWAVEALRVAKPGAHLLAFGGTRTHHRLACAIEDAGWEIRDTVMWVYGSGFPKSLDVAQAIEKKETTGGERRPEVERGVRRVDRVSGAGAVRKGADVGADEEPKGKVPLTTDAARAWSGWGTALKPAWEPIIVARKPLIGTVAANVLAHGTGAINIDRCRIDGVKGVPASLSDAGLLGWGTGGDMDRKGEQNGRWPANLIHDGSDEVLAGFPQTDGGTYTVGGPPRTKSLHIAQMSEQPRTDAVMNYGDSGSAARFFYTAKASRRDREEGLDDLEARTRGERDGRQMGNNPPHSLNGSGEPINGTGMRAPVRNTHPTVKPTSLMRWLVKLVTPPGGLVLDPFMGSGSTGKACMLEGFRFYGIEQDADYLKIARRRIDHARGHRTEILAELDEEAALLGATTAKPVARQQPGLFDLF